MNTLNVPAAHARPGFTLLEVAFVVVLGLVIMSGTTYAYFANKEQAAGAAARARVQVGQTVIETFAATNHAYPVSGSGQFSTMFASGHPDEAVVSPWGGPPGNPTQGASEDTPYTDGTADPATAPDKTSSRAADPTRHGNLHYTSIDNSAYVKVTTRYTGDTRTLRAYVLSIYDSRGNPWFDAAGASK